MFISEVNVLMNGYYISRSTSGSYVFGMESKEVNDD